MFIKVFSLLVVTALIGLLILKLNQPIYPELSDDLVFQRTDGLKQTFRQLKGKPLLVTFWSPNCVPCMSEVKDLNRLYHQHQGGSRLARLEILALSMYYDRPDWVIESSQKAGMKYPVYFDLQKSLSTAFGNVLATPTSFLLNSQGEVIYHHTGRLDFSAINQKLSELTG